MEHCTQQFLQSISESIHRFSFSVPVALYFTNIAYVYTLCILVSYLFRVLLDTVSLLLFLLCSSCKRMTIEQSVGNCRILFFFYTSFVFGFVFQIVLYSFRLTAAEYLYRNCHACQMRNLGYRTVEMIHFTLRTSTSFYCMLSNFRKRRNKRKISRRQFCKLLKF